MKYFINYLKKEAYKGYDPYDGLNSPIIQNTPLGKSRFVRLAWIQLFKRLPFNLRPFVGIKKEYNPKGLGLFLNGYCNLYKMDPKEAYLKEIKFLIQEIQSLKSEGYSGACWGYNFDWQARAFFQPKGTPTVVATTFISYALLDAYDILKDESLLNTARSACDFVLKDLNRTPGIDDTFAWSYSPLDHTQVFNATLLGARLLSRVYSYTGEKHLMEEAEKTVRYVCNHQQENGAWAYSNLSFHQWIDNFHTGYNLECIYEYQKYSGDQKFQSYIDKGLAYYLNTFFTEEGICKYYNNSVFPIDIHAPAQFIATMYRMGILEEHRALADKILNWVEKHMKSKEGYYYYQKKKYFNSKVPYIRWAQSWMFYALTFNELSLHQIKTN